MRTMNRIIDVYRGTLTVRAGRFMNGFEMLDSNYTSTTRKFIVSGKKAANIG